MSQTGADSCRVCLSKLSTAAWIALTSRSSKYASPHWLQTQAGIVSNDRW